MTSNRFGVNEHHDVCAFVWLVYSFRDSFRDFSLHLLYLSRLYSYCTLHIGPDAYRAPFMNVGHVCEIFVILSFASSEISVTDNNM